jgi:signal transduction histidine kinase
MQNEIRSETRDGPSPNGTSLHERSLLDIIDTVREPFLVLDSSLRVTHANHSFLRTFQVAREDTIGEVLFTLDDGAWDIRPLHDLLRNRLSADRELFDIDIEHVFPRIGRKTVLLNARLVTHHADAPTAILLSIEDVTMQRLTERRLATQRRELERSNAALNEFAFVASHDLQEPLRKIVSFGERLDAAAGSSLEANARQYLDRMLDAATRMRALIQDLLAYSQVATSALPFAPTSLTAIARDVVADLETALADAGGRIEVRGLPAIDADAPQMRRLLQNLLGNALKFRRRETPPLVLVAGSVSRDGMCTITVSDNGIGFKQEHEERIFRMFERLHTRTEFQGSGMGLTICQKIVERHGGSIAATSSIGHGATFTITLPVTQSGAEPTP